MLADDELGEEVDAEVAGARARIVSGVPNFTVQGRFEVRCAQPPEGFKAIFEKVKEMEG